MSNTIKAGVVGITALALLGLTAAFAAEDLKSTGLEPVPISSDPVLSIPATSSTMSADTDMNAKKAVDNATLAVSQAQQATDAAKTASDAAKVATDVAKMATDRATDATNMAKSAMDASSGKTTGASIPMGTDMAPSTKMPSDSMDTTLSSDRHSSVKE